MSNLTDDTTAEEIDADSIVIEAYTDPGVGVCIGARDQAVVKLAVDAVYRAATTATADRTGFASDMEDLHSILQDLFRQMIHPEPAFKAIHPSDVWRIASALAVTKRGQRLKPSDPYCRATDAAAEAWKETYYTFERNTGTRSDARDAVKAALDADAPTTE